MDTVGHVGRGIGRQTSDHVGIGRKRTAWLAYKQTGLPIGGQDLTNAIARRLGVEPQQAEELKRDPGDQVAIMQDAIGQTLEDLGNEVNLSFDFFENQFDGEVQEVWLTGGTSLLPLLEESFEKIFEKRTKTWNPIEGLKVKADNVDVEALNQLSPQLAVAVGLAAAT